MNTLVDYLPKAKISNELDLEIRAVLTTCFTKPEDAIFKKRRYFNELYAHSWVIRNEHQIIVAHIGVHEKQVDTEDNEYPIAGISEVCVHPEYRGRGYVKTMLQVAHKWLIKNAFTFSVLFGDPRVYASSKYTTVSNVIHGSEKEGWEKAKVLVRELSQTPWPKTQVRLPGPKF